MPDDLLASARTLTSTEKHRRNEAVMEIHTAEVQETMYAGRNAVEKLASMVDDLRTENDRLTDALRRLAENDLPDEFSPGAFAEAVLREQDV